MKTSSMVFISALLCASTTSGSLVAQGIYIGGKGGFGSSSYSVKEEGQEVEGLSARSGVMAGILGGFQTGSVFAAEVQFMFARKGFESDNTDGEGFRVDYVQIPLLARATFSEENVVNPRVFVGPIIGFETTCDYQAAGALEPISCPFETNSTEAGILLGGGISVSDPIQFTVDVTFDFGLTNVRGDTAGETSFKSRRLSFLFGIEYAFWDRSGY